MKTPPPVPPEFLTPQTPVNEQSPASSPPLTPEVEAMIAEAESRGYHRGRNESIANLMASPGDTDPSLSCDANNGDDDDSNILILNTFRPSIWD